MQQRTDEPAQQPAPSRPTVLLTGFGPFPGIGANATSVLVPQLAALARRALPGTIIVSHILPTEWDRSLTELESCLRIHRPVVALHFGVSSKANGFDIEVRGQNACIMSEDAAGLLPLCQLINANGPDYLAATIPAAHIVSRLRRLGLPSRLSRDAGGYLCNAVLYRSLEFARVGMGAERTGFVHLPSHLVRERTPEREPLPARHLSWDDVMTGGLEIIRSTLRQAPTTIRHGQTGRRVTRELPVAVR
ncbi:MAG: hypothetical protein ACK5JT_17775 [Hyphomicrobiaceae bacterium]